MTNTMLKKKPNMGWYGISNPILYHSMNQTHLQIEGIKPKPPFKSYKSPPSWTVLSHIQDIISVE